MNGDLGNGIAEKLIKRGKVTWRSFSNLSTNPPISAAWGIKGWPTTLLIDQQGVIRCINLYGSGLHREIETLLGIAEESGVDN